MKTLKDANPITAFLWIILTAGIAMFSMNPILLCISTVGAALYFYVRNPDAKLVSLLPWLLLLLLSALMNPLFSHNGATVLFVMNHNPITLEALVYGLMLGLAMLAVIYWFKSFQQLMTSDKLLYIFGSLFPKLTLVLSIALRYIPLLKKQIRQIRDSQKALGLFKEENLLDRFRGELRIFSVLVTWALENGIITADSMTARGYGIGRRSRFALFHFRLSDGLMCIGCALLSALTIVPMALGALDFRFYPTIRPHDMSLLSAAAYYAYGLLCLFPSILELEENLRWKSLRSKI